MKFTTSAVRILALAIVLATPVKAEVEISAYMGAQSLPHSTLEGTNIDGDFSRHVKWEGRPIEMPPYWGLRAMWWKDRGIGYGVEFTHAKAYLSDEDMAALKFDRFEFSDGHNLITFNVSKRWLEGSATFAPYVGAGVGIAVPHVDVKLTDEVERTFGYQYAGPVLRVTAGAKMALTERLAAFGEYQFTVSQNKVTLTNGQDMQTRLITNALNVGLSYSF